MASSSSNTAALLLATTGVAAAAVGLALTALQSDTASRKWLLTAEKLRTKRTTEYVYRWNKALAKAFHRITSWNSAAAATQQQQEDLLLRTNLLTRPEEITAFCEKLVSNKHKQEFANLRVIRIGKDEQQKNNNNKEHYVWLVNDKDSPSGCDYYQLPLGPFCTVLEEQLQRQVITATFCFVADASAQLGSHMMVDLIRHVDNEKSVFVVEQPYWMVCLAALIEQGLYSNETLQKVVFSLVRLEALRAPKSCSTVLWTLPGQAVVAHLLPLLQAVFPDDRHVFCYTGCINTVEHAWRTRRADRKTTTQMPTSWSQAAVWTDPVSYTTPLARLSAANSNLMAPFDTRMAALPVQHADVVESWMSAVDTYFGLKQADKKNGYLPYVCKLDYLFGLLDTSSSSSESLLAAPDTPSYWALRSLLQFVTGTKSREMPAEKMQTAVQWLQSYYAERQDELAGMSSSRPTVVDPKAIENAVFEHKLILIENKTLLDTVQPAEHWTLKAAVKRGCACCLPEDDEEEDEEEDEATSSSLLAVPGAFATAGGLSRRTNAASSSSSTANNQKKKNAGWQDGKTTFAFDPTKFS